MRRVSTSSSIAGRCTESRTTSGVERATASRIPPSGDTAPTGVKPGSERSTAARPARRTGWSSMTRIRATLRSSIPGLKTGSVAGGAGLAQERAGRLLEDLAPCPDLVLLGREVLDDLAHARGRDLDPVAGADLVE